MHIVISHLTRMSAGYICVAGHEITDWAPERPLQITGSLKRPVLPYQHITEEMLEVFQLGSVVDLVSVSPRPKPPHIEDVVFSPTQCRPEAVPSADAFWHVLETTAAKSLAEIFGDVLKRHNQTLYVDADKPLSAASLRAMYEYEDDPEFSEDSNAVEEKEAACSLGQWITDASLVEITCTNPTHVRLALP